MSWLFSWVWESVRLCVWACVYVCANVLHNKSECTKRLFRKNLQNENEFKHKPKGKNVNKQFYKLIVNLFYSKNEHSAIWMLQSRVFSSLNVDSFSRQFILSIYLHSLIGQLWEWQRDEKRVTAVADNNRIVWISAGAFWMLFFSPKPTRFVKFLFGCGTFQTAGQWHCFGFHIEGISREDSHSRPAYLTAN